MPRYRATRPIYIGWALAHPAGDVVPEANVEANGWAQGDDPLVEEIPDEPLAPPGAAAFIEPAGEPEAATSEATAETQARPELDSADARAEQEPTKPAATRRSQKQ